MLQNFLMNESLIILFILILLRVSSFLVSSSIFSSIQVPVHVKILFSVCVSLLLFESQKKYSFQGDGTLIFLVFKEVLIGLSLGMLTRFFFHAIAMGSELTSMSLGLNAASVFNPASGINSNLIEQFQGVLAVLVFFSIQGHHLLIAGISQSFDIIPLDLVHFKLGGVKDFIFWTKNLFEIAIKISAPVLCSIFLVNLSMGVLGRAVPQINVFVTSFQVTVVVGFLVLFVSMPLFLNEMLQVLDLTQTEFTKFMRSL
ncbi:MAG: flagellar biosynthetic protein FliR [Bdellovibrionaceae bacterium]|nr:flagellar biosynthetic protein FliR [Pseudobdellovibrionaceae bacterium]NUM57205.1 flagellar biosynthetic protein FliR [Pseudobdellovibrionaceae bacterium]